MGNKLNTRAHTRAVGDSVTIFFDADLEPEDVRVRIAVVGLGFMGATHVKAIGSAAGVTLAGVCSSDENKLTGDLSAVGGNIGAGERFDFSGIKRFRTLEALFVDPEIDAIDFCLPTDLHEAAAVAALHAGKHVLLEKPMALNRDSCDRILAAAHASGRVLMVAQVLRFFPMYTALRSAAPALGEIRAASFRRRCAMPGWGGWLKDKSRSGGGVFDLLIHDVDMCRHLFGAPESVSASGFEDLARGIDVIDARFHFAGGLAVTISGGWHPGAFPFSMDYSIVGDAGAIEYSSAGLPPTRYGSDGAALLALDEADGYAAEIAYFAECARSGSAPERCLPEDSAEAVRLTSLMSEARQWNGEKISCR